MAHVKLSMRAPRRKAPAAPWRDNTLSFPFSGKMGRFSNPAFPAAGPRIEPVIAQPLHDALLMGSGPVDLAAGGALAEIAIVLFGFGLQLMDDVLFVHRLQQRIAVQTAGEHGIGTLEPEYGEHLQELPRGLLSTQPAAPDDDAALEQGDILGQDNASLTVRLLRDCRVVPAGPIGGVKTQQPELAGQTPHVDVHNETDFRQGDGMELIRLPHIHGALKGGHPNPVPGAGKIGEIAQGSFGLDAPHLWVGRPQGLDQVLDRRPAPQGKPMRGFALVRAQKIV